jgi:putative PIN family toxin of toxin-antitoxin system
MRAVLDPNVLISALLSRDGSPARVFRAWLDGEFELVVSEELLAELERALAYPKLRERVQQADALEFVDLLRRGASVRTDPSEPPSVRSSDANDDYPIALAESTQAMLVSGDRPLLALATRAPIFAPADFLAELAKGQ